MIVLFFSPVIAFTLNLVKWEKLSKIAELRSREVKFLMTNNINNSKITGKDVNFLIFSKGYNFFIISKSIVLSFFFLFITISIDANY